MDVDGMLLFWRAGAVVLAWLSGWLLGRTPPDWRGDDEVVGGSDLNPSYYAEPLVVRGRGFFSGSWGAAGCALAALLLVYLGWPEIMEIDADAEGSWAALGLSPGIWLAIGAWLCGWVLSRLGDKGPVGPLE